MVSRFATQQESEYDVILREATKRSLESYISIEEIECAKRQFKNGRWYKQRDPKRELKYAHGLIEHQQELVLIQQMINDERQRNFERPDDPDASREPEKLCFSCLPSKGEKLPILKGIRSPFGRRLTTLGHEPGQVIVLVMFKNDNYWKRFFQCCQEMLLRKQSEWDGRVRIVAVNKAGKTPSNIEDEDHKPVDWTLIEHLELQKGARTFIDMLQITNPTVLLLNTEGTVDYFGDIFSIGIERKIVQLLAGESKSICGLTSNKSPSESRVGLLQQLLQNPPPYNGSGGVHLQLNKTRAYRYGQQGLTGCLTITSYWEKNNTKYTEFVAQITDGLKPDQFITQRCGQHQLLQIEFDKMQIVLRRHGIYKKPIILQSHKIDLLQSQNWESSQQIEYPDIEYKIQCTIDKKCKLLKDAKDMGLYNKVFEFKTVGSQFTGIFELKGYDLCGQCHIYPKFGISMLILQFHDRIKMDQLLNLARNNSQEFEIHLLGSIFNKQIVEKSKYLGNVFLYDTNSCNQDLEAYGLNSSPRVLIINSENIVIKIQEMTDFTCLKDLISSWQPAVTDQTSLDFLEMLATCYDTLRLRQVAAIWDYSPSIKIVYQNSASFHNKKERRLKSGSVHLSIRQQHQHFTDFLIDSLRQFGFTINANYIKTLDIANGDSCTDCGDNLNLPYYFYPWSKVHRCVDCAERQDIYQENILKRFAINQNAILIRTADCNIDVAILANNAQPKSQTDRCAINSAKSIPRFGHDCCICRVMGCTSYICLGCNRLPQSNRLRFCSECIKNGTELIDLRKCPAHRIQHPMLRVLYSQSYSSSSYY